MNDPRVKILSYKQYFYYVLDITHWRVPRECEPLVVTWDWRAAASWWWSHQCAPRRSCWWPCFPARTSAGGRKHTVTRSWTPVGGVNFITVVSWLDLMVVSYLDELRLPGVQGERAHFGEVDSKAPGGNKRLLNSCLHCQVSVSLWECECMCICVRVCRFC